MSLLKHERERLAALLEEGGEERHSKKCVAYEHPAPCENLRGCLSGAEVLTELVAKELDRLRGERTHVFGCAIVAGVPLAVGPYSTRNQVEKAMTQLGADRVWVVPGWTADGWERHIAELDTPPEKRRTTSKEEQKKATGFWAKVSQIRDHEVTAIVAKNKSDVEIKPFKIPKGVW